MRSWMIIVDEIGDEIVDEIVAGGITMCIVTIAKALNLNSFVGRGGEHKVYSKHGQSTSLKQICRRGVVSQGA